LVGGPSVAPVLTFVDVLKAYRTMEGGLTAIELTKVRESESIDGDDEFMCEILQMISTNLDQKLAVIKNAVTTGDHVAIWKAAHSVKGSALQCSLDGLSEAAKQVELRFKESGEVTQEKTQLLDILANEAKRVQISSANLTAQMG